MEGRPIWIWAAGAVLALLVGIHLARDAGLQAPQGPPPGAIRISIATSSTKEEWMHQAIQALPPKFRAVVFLRYAAQLSFSEIAQALNMPTATAKTYFQRAKPLLCANLRDFVTQPVTH